MTVSDCVSDRLTSRLTVTNLTKLKGTTELRHMRGAPPYAAVAAATVAAALLGLALLLGRSSHPFVVDTRPVASTTPAALLVRRCLWCIVISH